MKCESSCRPARWHRRFTAKNRALVVFKGSEILPYHIVDISKSGLSFRYLGNKLEYSRISKVSLYYDFKLIVDSIPVEAVSDYQLKDGLVPIRRGSVFFKKMSDEQQLDLALFVEIYTE